VGIEGWDLETLEMIEGVSPGIVGLSPAGKNLRPLCPVIPWVWIPKSLEISGSGCVREREK